MRQFFSGLISSVPFRMSLIILVSILIPVLVIGVVESNNLLLQNTLGGLVVICATAAGLLFGWKFYRLAYECFFEGDDWGEYAFGLFFTLVGALISFGSLILFYETFKSIFFSF